MTEVNDKNQKSVQRYVNLLTNSGFKAVFGDRKNKEVVISVINALLPKHRKVSDIEYYPTEYQGSTMSNKEFRYDFMCRDDKGVVFIVEVQCYPDEYWFRRCVNYASRAYDRQNVRGEGYDVEPVYLIGLMGTEIKHESPALWENRFVSEYTFLEKYTHELQDETIVIIFAELARFDKPLENCANDLERMLFVLKNMGNLKKQPSGLRHEIFTRIFAASEIAQFDEEKRIKYDQDMYDERRLRGELNTAHKIGREEGREEGRKEGRKEGILEMAHKLLDRGMPVSEVALLTSLSEEELLK